MGMTIAEKIIARAAGVTAVKAGEIHTVTLDYLMSNDGTTHLTIDMYNKLRNPRIADKEKLVWIVDHNVPCDSPKTAASQKKMRDFAREKAYVTRSCARNMWYPASSSSERTATHALTALSAPSEQASDARIISTVW